MSSFERKITHQPTRDFRFASVFARCRGEIALTHSIHKVRLGVWMLLMLSAAVLTRGASAESWHEPLRPFLQTHCGDCHSGEEPAGALDLATLSTDLTDAESMRRWILIHDRIDSGEMPPAAAPPLSKPDRSRAVATLSQHLTVASRAESDVVLRRLNRNEYENTVRDLFDVTVDVKEILPADTPTDGFDNVGAGLAVSAEAAGAYLRAADVVLDAVFGTAKPPKYIQHKTNLLDQKTHDGKPQLDNQIGKMFRRTDKGLVIFQSGYCPTNLVNFARLRAPAGTYRGRMQVRAIQSATPVTLRIYAGDTIVGRREKHLVGYYDVPPEVWTTIEFTDRLVESSGTFQPKCYGTRDTRKDANTYPEPGIEIGDITIEGPLEPWPPLSRAKLLGDIDLATGTLDDARTVLDRILPLAFRRETSVTDRAPYLKLVESALQAGRSFESALRLGLKGVLCSPDFLFLDEPGEGTVSQFALATRLAYFLWSSLPDDELSKLARQGRLADPDVLRQQVDRLLADPKSLAFVKSFTGQWLDLRDIDFTEPDMNLYPGYDELLRISMVEETELFFQELLAGDLSLLNFVASDFTFLNERLARHYGIEGVKGQAFRRVQLPPDSVRGGLMTQASILKVTANGTNTSPVLRGAWIMENILGRSVPPPPANVAAVEPDIRGATTLREQLAKHRNDESCATCHRQFDPAGFALENFDVVGGWRDHYRTLGEGRRPDFSQHPLTFAWIRYKIGLPVDATGTTADGQAFQDIRQFKKILLRDQHAITKGLTEKLATYASGRRMGFADRNEIERIVRHVSERGYGFRTLVHEVVQSELFQKP